MSGQTPAEDDLDRQLRELTEGSAGAARFREPSAAERAKAAKKRSKQARKQATARRRRDPGPAAGWRGGARHDLSVKEARKHAKRAGKQAARVHRRATRGRRAVRALSWVVVIAILGSGAWFGYQQVHHRGATVSGGARGVLNAMSGTSGNGVPTGPGADPFAGSPADHWANGAAGIVVPAAKPVGRFSAAQVAAAYAATKQLLIAETLDQQTLAGGAPTAYARLLTPSARSQFLAGLNVRGAYKTGQSRSTRSFVESFAPGTAQLIGSVIKVKATMSAQEYHEAGRVVLAINVSDLVAYPVERPGHPSVWMRVVADVYGFVAFAHWDSPSGPLQPWGQTIVANSGIQCPMTDGWVHPVYPSLQAAPASGVPATNGPYTPVSAAPSAVPTAVPTSGTACTVGNGST